MTATPAPVAPPAIAVHGLVRSFADQRVLDGVDLAVAPGSIHALLGSNGTGKTTLVRILATSPSCTADGSSPRARWPTWRHCSRPLRWCRWSVVDPWRSQPDRWLDDVLLYGAADEALARLGPDARPHSDRLFDLMVDSVSVERRIDHDARRPEPLGTDSVITRFKAGS